MMEKVFEALAALPRRKILTHLDGGEMTASELSKHFEFSKPALSNHLRILEEAGLIEREKRGQYVHFRLVRERIANTVFSWASELCPVAGPIKRANRKTKGSAS